MEEFLKKTQTKLYEKLKPSGWGDKLKVFLLSRDFYNILETLYKESANGKKFTPVLKEVFRAFEECPYSDLKVIIVGQDPYPQADVADGISFSCSKSEKAQPSLKYILDEVDSSVYKNKEVFPQDLDLKRWSNQGVLMLNTALTCQINNIGSHVTLWRPFMEFLFDMLANNNNGLLYVFLGTKAKSWSKNVPNINYKFFASHPASAAYKGKKQWNSGNLFNSLNKILKENYGEEIKW